MNTKYAPADRSTIENLLESNLSLDKITYLNEIFCSLSFIFCILDKNRQIVYTNDTLLKTLEVENIEQLLGKRFGEAINCRFAFEEEGRFERLGRGSHAPALEHALRLICAGFK